MARCHEKLRGLIDLAGATLDFGPAGADTAGQEEQVAYIVMAYKGTSYLGMAGAMLYQA